MMKISKNVLVAVSLTFLYGVFFYFSTSFLWNKGWLISLNDITSQNIWIKFLSDTIINLLFVILIFTLLFLKNRSLSEMGFTKNSRLASILLLGVYLIMFLSHGDFTVRGYYLAFFYLVIVAFSEEFIFRGFLFTQINQEYGFGTGIIISGLLFGAMHGLLPTIVTNGSLADLFTNISSNLLGQGIIGGGLFALVYKKSGTLFVPILIHAILNYSSVLFG
ncbi:hypothetical protein IGI53_002954 [Enterococcus sp. DIV0788_1]